MPLQSRILYQSIACIVVNKKIGEVTEGASGDNMINLPKELAAILPADTELIEASHRIDVPVTGCSLFALTKSSLTFLNSAFAEENSPIKKTYWAIIEKPKNNIPENAELVHWIEINKKINKSFAHKVEGAGRKKAVLCYKITGEGTNYLFIEIELLTGRHHQIRAQFAAAGMHIKGDLKYGAKRSEKGGGIRLHSRSLSFPNPLNNREIVTVKADPPQMDNLWCGFFSGKEELV